MERTKKGVSLVEVIVAIAVFSVISLTLFSAVIGLKSVVDRQEEYVKLEMICYDISAYHTKQTNELPWYKSYFGSGITLNNYVGIGYLKSDFSPTLDQNEAAYIIRFSANQVISISDVSDTNTFVEGVKLPIEEAKQ